MSYVLHYARFHVPGQEEHETLHEAAWAAWGMVEHNEAAPTKLVGPDGRKIAQGYDISGLVDEDWYFKGIKDDEVRRQLRNQHARARRAAKRADEQYHAGERAREGELRSLLGQEVTYQFVVHQASLQDEILARDEPVGYPGDLTWGKNGPEPVALSRTGRVEGLQVKVDTVRTGGVLGPCGRHPLRHPHMMLRIANGDLVHLEEVKRYQTEGDFFAKRGLTG